MLADAYIHNLDPVILHLGGGFAVRWYGLSYLVGFIIAYVMLKWMAKTRRVAIPAERVLDLIFACVFGVVIGGRLGYCIFYDLPRAISAGEIPLLWNFDGSPPFWGLLRLNQGGMASHGGILGVLLAGLYFARRHGGLWRHVMDCVAFAAPIGLGIGRIANFINGELWGKSLPTSMRADPPGWSVKYPTEITAHWLRALQLRASDHPQAEPELQALVHQMAADFEITAPHAEALRDAVLLEASQRLEALEPLRATISDGDDFYSRIVEAAYGGQTAVIEHIRPLLTPYYPSQIIQAFGEGLAVFAALAIIWLRPRKPGMIGAWFLVVYGVQRIATEVFRQPDEGVAIILGLQRGQLLSVLMIVLGAYSIWWVHRQPQEKVGGLLKPPPTPPWASAET